MNRTTDHILASGLACLLFFILAWRSVHGQTPVQIPYTLSEIKVDGNSREWNNYHKTLFYDTLCRLHNAPDRELMAFFDASYDYSKTWPPLSHNHVEVWMCWDLNNLYFAFHVHDNHLFAQVEPKGKTPDIHLNDGIEVYLDSKNDSDTVMDINDYQFLIDVAGNSLVFRGDRELMERDTFATPKTAGQNIYFEYGTTFEGTLSDNVIDSAYVIEIAIPFTAIGLKPSTGLRMKMDIGNNDIDYPLDNVQTYAEKSLRYWPFNWIGISDFGYPETWKEVQLAGSPGWWDQMTGAQMRRWFTGYMTTLLITMMVIAILIIRMRKKQRLPSREEIPAPKIVFLEKKELDHKPALSPNEAIHKKAMDYIAQNCSENIRSENLAKEIGVTIRKLQRITQEELQTTPTNFIYLIKLNMAADFLKNRKGNISETAYEFGFSDPGYFSKLFKKHFGVSPLEYLDKNDNSHQSSVN